MRSSFYNSAIVKMIPPNHAFPTGVKTCGLLWAVLCLAFLNSLFALDPATPNWSEAERQLARKIVTVTGPGAVTLTVNNRSSLTRKENDIVVNGLRAALEADGIRFVASDRAAATIGITLSENQTSYVWVAEIQQGAGERAIVMISNPRPVTAPATRDSIPLTLQKISIWRQPERILDLAVLEEGAAPTHIAVLDKEKVTLYRWQGAKWQPEQSLPITHSRPWPRDMRGRLVSAKDHLLDVYLPGLLCRVASAPALTLSCHESDDPWPLAGQPLSVGTGLRIDTSLGPNAGTISTASPLKAFFAPTRNFFTGVVSPRIGKFSNVPQFFSLAFVPRDKYVIWLLAGLDGQVHMVDGISDTPLNPGSEKSKWGSDLATIRTACGAGWQVLAVNSGRDDDTTDVIRAYEFPDRDPLPVTAGVDLSGEITALWTEAAGSSAIVVARNRETEEYEASRLSVTCSQ